MSEERDRLEDLNIEEAIGRNTPPDLTDRILQAAEQRDLDEAVTPPSGRHAVVPRSMRPSPGRRMTASVKPAKRKNWQGVGFVAIFGLLIAAGIAGFVLLKILDETHTVQPETAEDQDGKDEDRDAPLDSAEDLSEPEQQPDPQPERPTREKPQTEDPEMHPEPAPDRAKPDDKPEPAPGKPEETDVPERPDEVVEKPQPTSPDEPEPGKPAPEQPGEVVEKPDEEEKEPDDKTEAVPPASTFVVASVALPLDRAEERVFERQFRVRNREDSRWVSLNDEDATGIERDEEAGVYFIHEGTKLIINTAELSLSNGAMLYGDGEIRMFGHAQGMRVELDEDDLYVDNLGAPTPVRVTREHMEAVVDQGAALFARSNNGMSIFCLDGEVAAGGDTIEAGNHAMLGGRGLVQMGEISKSDYRHNLLTTLPPRHIGIEEFDDGPANGMIRGTIEPRTPIDLGRESKSNVGVARGEDATVSFQFDGDHIVMTGELIRIRYRHQGAEKLILQLWNPDKADNYGVDLSAMQEGEWHVIEIRTNTLLDRETHSDKLKTGERVTSIGLHSVGKLTELEVDWIEIVRAPEYGK